MQFGSLFGYIKIGLVALKVVSHHVMSSLCRLSSVYASCIVVVWKSFITVLLEQFVGTSLLNMALQH